MLRTSAYTLSTNDAYTLNAALLYLIGIKYPIISEMHCIIFSYKKRKKSSPENSVKSHTQFIIFTVALRPNIKNDFTLKMIE